MLNLPETNLTISIPAEIRKRVKKIVISPED